MRELLEAVAYDVYSGQAEYRVDPDAVNLSDFVRYVLERAMNQYVSTDGSDAAAIIEKRLAAKSEKLQQQHTQIQERIQGSRGKPMRGSMSPPAVLRGQADDAVTVDLNAAATRKRR